jgi:acyl-CoA dehydrogenase
MSASNAQGNLKIRFPKDRESALGRYEYTMKLNEEAWPVFKKLYKAIKAKELPKEPYLEIADLAAEKGVITKEEAEFVKKTEIARNDAIQVDEFTPDSMKEKTFASVVDKYN